MLLLITSFLAGILTVFAPCVLVLLPVIVGSSLIKDKNKKADRIKPYVISVSLGVSVLLFTLILKASTALIGVDPRVWTSISGGIVIVLGLSLLFPLLWVKIAVGFGFENGSNSFLAHASKKSGIGGYILTGAALGPVFASCSPIYALILATVLPVNLALGTLYMTIYAIGLTLTLLTIALAGRRVTKRVNWTAKPDGWFRRSLAVLLIIVGVAVLTGLDKSIQTWFLIHVPFNSTKIEQKLVPDNSPKDTTTSNVTTTKKASFNVKNPYSAPEFAGIADWVNSDPQTIAGLKGKVVLVDFWTYSCINCIRTQPYLNSWYEKYKDSGLVIIGAHAPEFAFEKVPANVRKAVKDAGIKYPVALDNNLATWGAYKNQYWPAKYLIDKDGKIRYTHFGEGNYDDTEAAIQTLLKEMGQTITQEINIDPSTVPVKAGQTPETYLNYERGERFANTDQFSPSKTVTYTLSDKLKQDEWSLGGNWQVGAKESVATGPNAVLRIKFTAKELYLVMDGPATKPVTLKLNDQAVTATTNGGSDVDAAGLVRLSGARLYKLVSLPAFTAGSVLDITVPEGTTINAFTFGA